MELYTHNSTNPTLLTQLYSTQLIIQYQSQAKPFHTPLEAVIHVKTTVDHSPLSGSNHKDSPPGGRRMEQDKIHLEIEEILKKVLGA